MSSIIRSISLDEQTAVIAKSIPNFSKFVRECLLRYHAVEHDAGCPVERIGGGLVYGLCVPGGTRVCLKHWPKGRPTMDDWKKFRLMHECPPKRLYEYYPDVGSDDFNGTKVERIDQWIQRQAVRRNPAQIEFAGMVVDGNAKYQRKQKKNARMRLLAFLRRKKS